MRRPRPDSGMTILEVVMVVAIVGLMSYLAVGAVRWLRGANAVDASVELAAVMRRAQQLATGSGELHRVVLDLDAQTYRVEICAGGPAAITKDPEKAVDESEDARKRAVEEAKQRLQSLPQNALPAGEDQAQSEDMALALAGQLHARRICVPSADLFGDPDGRAAIRAIDPNRSARIKQVWVQHLRDPASTGLVAIHFFPLGSTEKAIVEIGDGSKTFTVLSHGLTGRIELRDGTVRDPDEFLFRDATGEKEAER